MHSLYGFGTLSASLFRPGPAARAYNLDNKSAGLRDTRLYGPSASAMQKHHILREIKRTAAANREVAPGSRRFSTETGVRDADWLGKY